MLAALVLATRCANLREVFVGDGIYFTDADCYSRMTRARLCFEHPGFIIRHHDFENFPTGITPHTTAPFDYAIVGLAELLRPFSGRALDLAGALISPLLGLAAAVFLWWWLREMRFRFRAAGLLLFAASPMLVHATELGRPDHQSLLLLTLTIAICGEWTLLTPASRAWQIASGVAWGLSLWVSLYEPLVLLAVVLTCRGVSANRKPFGFGLRYWWFTFTLVVAVFLAIERRVSFLSAFSAQTALMANWLSTISEMHPLPLSSELWLQWCGYLLPVAPLLIAYGFRRRKPLPLAMVVLLVSTFLLTWLQVRWGYFFVAIFAIVLPAMLSIWGERRSATITLGGVLLVSIFPLLKTWDAMIWPNESILAQRIERRTEAVDLREASIEIGRNRPADFIAPWWLSPEIAYWSKGRGVAGSSHESLPGIADVAQFFINSDAKQSRAILLKRNVQWVIAYDDKRVLENAGAILPQAERPSLPLASILMQSPSSAPPFLVPVFANATCKVYRVQNSPISPGFP